MEGAGEGEAGEAEAEAEGDEREWGNLCSAVYRESFLGE